ncbi:MAG: DoxX family protein [Terriglobales bacterium]
MAAQAQNAQLQLESQTPHWNLASLIAFRFCFVYFGLFCIYTQIFGGLIFIPKMETSDPSSLWPMRQIVFWTAAHIFGAKLPLVYTGSGSGDKTFDWVLAFCLLVFSAVATGVWSILDRKRENYVTLYKWFRVFIRFALASQLVGYGIAKVVPLQMPFPFLTRLLEPFGNFSPMGVLWSSIGASPSYEIFAGCAEMLGGILLILPWTTTLGALVCVADMTQVFMLNMTYDVPVKLFSFHLLLMALLLLAPECGRLLDFFFRNRAVEPSTQPQLFKTRRDNRIAIAVQLLFGLWMVGTAAYGAYDDWHAYGGGRPKSALYGIWNVDELSIDGQLRSPLLTDYDRWHRVVFDFPERASFQRMDDTFASYGAKISITDKTLVLTKSSDKNWKANFTFERPAPDQLILDGEMDGHKIHMQLRLVDRDKFLLVNHGFHWIQEYPVNR